MTARTSCAADSSHPIGRWAAEVHCSPGVQGGFDDTSSAAVAVAQLAWGPYGQNPPRRRLVSLVETPGAGTGHTAAVAGAAPPAPHTHHHARYLQTVQSSCHRRYHARSLRPSCPPRSQSTHRALNSRHPHRTDHTSPSSLQFTHVDFAIQHAVFTSIRRGGLS